MKAYNIKLKEFPGWIASEANDYESIRGAIIMARATGSTGSTEITKDVDGKILKYAKVKRI